MNPAPTAPPAPPANPVPPVWETEANALSLQGVDRDLYQILRGFHGFNPQQCSKLRLEGYA